MANRDVPVVDIQLPDIIIEDFRQMLDEGDKHQFNVGDFIVVILEEFPTFPRAEIIKQLADRTGSDRSTLRDRHNMAQFFPPAVRREFDMLTYSQLRACKSAGDQWREYAEWAMDNMPAPVAVIRARVKNNGDDQPHWINRWDRVVELARLLVNDIDAPSIVRKSSQVVLAGDENVKARGYG